MSPVSYPSPNHGNKRPSTRGVILHSTRSGKFTREQEYQKTIDYMLLPGTVSAHRVIGVEPGQHALLVPDELIAWHAAEDNQFWLSIEFCQPLPTDEYSDWQVEQGIATVVAWFRKYAIAPSLTTILPHSGTKQGQMAGKSDPGEPFPYAEFVAWVQQLI